MKRCRPLLGTFVEIVLNDRVVEETGVSAAEHAVAQAFAAIERVQTLMSFHSPASELTRLNTSAHRVPQSVHPWTYEVLEAARDMFIATGGLFDCAVGARLMTWDFLPRLDGEACLAEALTARLSDLELHGNHLVSFRQPMCLDLGGIAKGYAVDQAIAVLKSCKIPAAVVNAGGDLRILGNDPEPVFVRHPQDVRQLVHAGDLADGAMATSACYFSLREVDGEARSALVNPSNGRANLEAKSYSVIAPTCMVADALTKAVAASQDDGRSFLARYDAEVFVI